MPLYSSVAVVIYQLPLVVLWWLAPFLYVDFRKVEVSVQYRSILRSTAQQHQDPVFIFLVCQFYSTVPVYVGMSSSVQFQFQKQFSSSEFNIQRKASQVTARTLCGDSGNRVPANWPFSLVSSSLLSPPFFPFLSSFLVYVSYPRGFHPSINSGAASLPVDQISIDRHVLWDFTVFTLRYFNPLGFVVYIPIFSDRIHISVISFR